MRSIRRKRKPVSMPRARRRCDLALILAASDGEWLGIDELLESFSTYLDCDYEVIAADDATTDGTYDRLLDRGVWVLRNPTRLSLPGNNLTMRRAFSDAVQLF